MTEPLGYMLYVCTLPFMSVLVDSCCILYINVLTTGTHGCFKSNLHHVPHSPSYTQSGIPFRTWFSWPVAVTCCGADSGLVFMYTSFP